jgi:hypothetical protein
MTIFVIISGTYTEEHFIVIQIDKKLPKAHHCRHKSSRQALMLGELTQFTPSKEDR